MLRGNVMKKNIYKCTLGVLSVILIVFILYTKTSSIKYPLDDCVTYFDDEARYQLIEIYDYYIQDLKTEQSIFKNVTSYAFYNNTFYVEFNEFKGYDGEPHHDNSVYERLYGTYNIIDDEKYIHTRIEDFDEIAKSIFNNNKIMIRLTPGKNTFVKQISQLIPLKYRKR